MSTQNDGGPAFPMLLGWRHPEGGWMQAEAELGMSLRDWFAGQALTGILANSDGGGWKDEIVAGSAYRLADAMLAARSRPTQEP